MTTRLLDPLPATVLPAPSLRRRMACFTYEGMILFGLGLIPGAVGALFVALTGQSHPLQSETALRIFAFVVYGVYFTYFWARRGQTLPMQTWHIRVVTLSGDRLSQPRALARYLVACLWFAPAALIATLNHWTRWDALVAVAIGVIGYALLALLHPQHQFWHDAICGTQLVDAKPQPRPKR
jgi:uncharacterized RDD family membrane protein YckC